MQNFNRNDLIPFNNDKDKEMQESTQSQTENQGKNIYKSYIPPEDQIIDVDAIDVTDETKEPKRTRKFSFEEESFETDNADDIFIEAAANVNKQVRDLNSKQKKSQQERYDTESHREDNYKIKRKTNDGIPASYLVLSIIATAMFVWIVTLIYARSTQELSEMSLRSENQQLRQEIAALNNKDNLQNSDNNNEDIEELKEIINGLEIDKIELEEKLKDTEEKLEETEAELKEMQFRADMYQKHGMWEY